MNIKILDSWLREYLKTKATPKQIAEILSQTSVSVERLEKVENDYIYDIEVTTNRPDLMSVISLAMEASAVLPESETPATFLKPNLKLAKIELKNPQDLEIKNDPKLVRRICAVIMEVKIKQSPQYIKDRLEASGIRSLNNVIDVTNYVMREVGHPTHVFDYDRLITKKIIIRESNRGERITTLDGKEYVLPGGDIVADNGKNEIIDLLGVMGTANSVVTENTKHILFFIDNVKPTQIRKTSMSLGIRTEAAQLNEKDINPSLTMDALLHGISLYTKIADAKILSEIIDIFPNIPQPVTINVSIEKINSVIGIEIPTEKSISILTALGFKVKKNGGMLKVEIPISRIGEDLKIEEDIIEEIARIYGYHKLPNKLPPIENIEIPNLTDEFYWENKVKDALKYWGFTETYSYSMVSEDLFEGSPSEAITLQNPLNEELKYMRRTLVPSLLQVIRENKTRDEIKIFEIANVYLKKPKSLPNEILTLAGVLKKPHVSFFEVKGIIQQLLFDLGIGNVEFKKRRTGGLGAELYINSPVIARSETTKQSQNYIGDIEILEDNLANFEFNFEIIAKHATLKKVYVPIPKFPPIIEDISIVVDPKITYQRIVTLIKKQSNLIFHVSLLDMYENKKTFRIKYQDSEKNLTNEDVAPIREKIYKALEKELKVKIV